MFLLSYVTPEHVSRSSSLGKSLASGLAGEGKQNLRLRAGFTLVELLVVIAIMSILASLLLPALQAAMYQTKLVKCTSNLKQVGLAAMLYANENRNRYPYRLAVRSANWGTPASMTGAAGTDRDLWQSMGLDEIYCPFGSPVDMAATTRSVVGSYSYFFGTAYDPRIDGIEQMSNVMWRVGKHFKVKGEEFDILASDIDITNAGRYALSSHPDRNTGALSSGPWVRSIHITNSYWWNDVGLRGPVDYNFCREDGSVFRINNVAQDDSRLSHIPYKYYNSDLRSLDIAYTLLPNVDQ